MRLRHWFYSALVLQCRTSRRNICLFFFETAFLFGNPSDFYHYRFHPPYRPTPCPPFRPIRPVDLRDFVCCDFLRNRFGRNAIFTRRLATVCCRRYCCHRRHEYPRHGIAALSGCHFRRCGQFYDRQVFWTKTVCQSGFQNFPPFVFGKTHAFYEKHGGKTIIIARFVPIVRTFAPFVAGMGDMHYATFIRYNIIGAVLWVLSFSYAGYFFANIPVVKNNLGLVMAAIIVISILPAVVEVIRAKLNAKK